MKSAKRMIRARRTQDYGITGVANSERRLVDPQPKPSW